MNKFIKTIIATVVISVAFVCVFSAPVSVHAAEGDGVDSISSLWDEIVSMFSFGLAGEIDVDDVTKSKCIPWSIAKTFVNWAGILAGLGLLGYLIYGGVTYMISSGDPGKMEQGQKTIINAMIGFAIVILAWSVAGLVMWLFGVSNKCVGGPTVSAQETETVAKKTRGEDCTTGPECQSGACTYNVTVSRLTCE